ncbi:hypothetical protein [Streptomyces sp. NPDC053560]|uniref:hypothetical protein n=1 Tax=Streptomyces sp. NPDC053560 TaxID=3365711 RepID=UPI0037D6B5BD
MTTLIHRAGTESAGTRTDADKTGPESGTTTASDTDTTTTDKATADTATTTDATTADVSSGARRKGTQADGMAVASFILGLVGLLVMNLVLGPLSLVLGAVALHRGTGRRGRALLGMALGAADLVVLAAIVTVDGTVSWNFPV